MGSPLYSREGSPNPYGGNEAREKTVIVRIRPNNISPDTIIEACKRISACPVSAEQIEGNDGLVINLTTTEPVMEAHDIDCVLEELRLHVCAIEKGRDVAEEQRASAASKPPKRNKGKKEVLNQPQLR